MTDSREEGTRCWGRLISRPVTTYEVECSEHGVIARDLTRAESLAYVCRAEHSEQPSVDGPLAENARLWTALTMACGDGWNDGDHGEDAQHLAHRYYETASDFGRDTS